MPVSTDDYASISDFWGRYCWAVDENRADDWVGLFTEDGVFTGFGPEPLVGREALKAIPASSFALSGGAMRHAYANLYLEYGETRDEVVAHLYNMVTNWKSGGSFQVMAVCKAQMVRDGASWKVKRNDAVMMR